MTHATRGECRATFREFDLERDRDATFRIWRECGWATAEHGDAFDVLLRIGRKTVAEIDGAAECFVMAAPGALRYLAEDLPFCLVAAVTTSRIARRRGCAGRLTARAVAEAVSRGEIVTGLGMFDQGFYDRLGFGTGVYEHRFQFDPSQLRVPGRVKPRVPRRLTADDAERMHANRLRRARRHGGCNVFSVDVTRMETRWSGEHGFGLGYEDEAGALTHHLWCDTGGDDRNGPYLIKWLAHERPEQLVELLALLRVLGDQVRQVIMDEPPGMQLQDLILHPSRWLHVTRGAPLGHQFRFQAWWQVRINDLQACVSRTRLRGGGELRFNLRLSDPIADLLPADAPWRGVAGDFVVTLGAASGVEPGLADGLPMLTGSISAFSRLWLGVLPASGLCLTTDLAAPPDLVAALDETLRELPTPHVDWNF